jgi:carbon monoxide dehydrogenase subunit G
MEITGSHRFPAPVERVYMLVTNPDLLARAIPGCERLVQLGPPDAEGATHLEARLHMGSQRTLRIVQVTLRPDPAAHSVQVDLRWHGDDPDVTREFAATGELRLEPQGGATTGAWTFTVDPSSAQSAGLAEDAVRGFADILWSNIDSALGERVSQSSGDSALVAGTGADLFVRTPYGTITMARSEPVWGAWVRTALLVSGGLIVIGGAIALAVTITRALTGWRGEDD